MTGVHRVLAWPAVQKLLRYDGAEMTHWEGDYKDTEHWLLGISKDFGVPLLLDWPVDIYYSDAGMLNLERGRSIALNKEYVENLCQKYFDSFHCTYPILDRKYFLEQVLPPVLQTSFSEAQDGTCLVLLVLALGSIAQEGVTGTSIVDQSGKHTGIRGGTVERPPGLIYLNEARRRFGINITNWNLTNLQTSILLSVYYAQTSRNLEYWRMAILSCTMCQGLVKRVVRWDTIYSDRIARCFWMCSIMEGGLTGELGLDLPAVQTLQDSVPLPLFLSEPSQLSSKTNDDLIIEYYFLAQITLRTLVNRARASIKESRSLFLDDEPESQSRDYIMQELSAQLDAWRSHLPAIIAWEEDRDEDVEMADTDMHIHREATTPVDPASTGKIDFKSILSSSLRTRYKYAKFIIWRPYVYQVLHFPSNATEHSYVCCQKAIKAYCLWPLTFATFQPQRRLIPHLYEYTHTFFTILILVHVSSFSPILGPMLQSPPVAQEIELSITLYLGWIRDMKSVHPVARWCWHLLKGIYKDHQLVREDQE
ncbi:hypothetical protein PVAG01_06314 [Phlyctema vagabunda]|uniref:Xylanolytic transcriptional activator regulatory domain-containing protein n=1 Tax=Phlyctema vagabunda TaxID=108571 RepID=A0ABR4PFN9_9HELO